MTPQGVWIEIARAGSGWPESTPQDVWIKKNGTRVSGSISGDALPQKRMRAG